MRRRRVICAPSRLAKGMMPACATRCSMKAIYFGYPKDVWFALNEKRLRGMGDLTLDSPAQTEMTPPPKVGPRKFTGCSPSPRALSHEAEGRGNRRAHFGRPRSKPRSPASDQEISKADRVLHRNSPVFSWSLTPIAMDEKAPDIVRAMIEASAEACVGPMATVAGAIADYVGRDLLAFSQDVIVENGGDILLHVSSKRELLVLAENSPFGALKIAVGPTLEPIGICTSSGTLGHSLSFGRADAVTIFGQSAAKADAAATSVGNLIQSRLDIETGIERAREIGVNGVLILVDDSIGVWAISRLSTEIFGSSKWQRTKRAFRN